MSSEPPPELPEEPPQPPPPQLPEEPPQPAPSSSSKNLLFCTSDILHQNFTEQPFATISIKEILKLREQGNVSWEEVCKKSTLRRFPTASSSSKVNNNQCSTSKNNADLSNEIIDLEDDQMMQTDLPENGSKLEQEIAMLRNKNSKLGEEKMRVLKFFGELQSCLGVSWSHKSEEEMLSESNLQTCLDRVKQLVENKEDEGMELGNLKDLEKLITFEEKVKIDRDTQTEEKTTEFADKINNSTVVRRKKGLCKVVGTNLQEYWCSCGRTFAHRDRIAAHIKINKLSWKFKCTECTLKFADLKTLKAHLETTHKVKNPIPDFNRGCIFCGKMLVTAEELTQHTETHKKEWVKHRKTLKIIQARTKVPVSLEGKPRTRKLKQKLSEPIKLTTNRKRTLYKCQLCTRTFSDHDRFLKHTTVEHKREGS